MPDWIKVTTTDKIKPGRQAGFTIKGQKIMITNIAGKFYAMDSVCGHAGGPLEEGEMNGTTVTCPWHGSQFDITSGRMKRGPAVKDQQKYDVKIEGNDIFVKI